MSPSDGCVPRKDTSPGRIILLDGGFSSQLSCRVKKQIDGDILWTSRFLATDPESVINTHLDFLIAGADVILTNTYQASVGGFCEHLHMSEEESYDLMKRAVELAKEARRRYKAEYPDLTQRGDPEIIGSVGPYGAFLHDGSEYTGSYAATTPPEVIRDWHRPRITALVEAGVDALGLETIPCQLEAEILVNLIRDFPGIKAWLSFSCGKDGASLASGEDFKAVALKCYDSNREQILAVGANCLAPRLVEDLFSGINNDREDDPVPLIVYPNSGESYNVEKGWLDRDKCEPVETYVHRWLDLGVKYIGGCCRTYAADVTRIGNEVRKWEYLKRNKRRNTDELEPGTNFQ